MAKKNKEKKTQEQIYKMYLQCFYVLRSDLKFKGYELTLLNDNGDADLKCLKTGKNYSCSIYDMMNVKVDEFIRFATNASWYVYT